MADPESAPAESTGPHPLQFKWTLWHDRTDKKAAYAANLREVASFDTVEDFWAYVDTQLFYSYLREAKRHMSDIFHLICVR